MWNTIKQILKKNKGTCIIVEDGQPAYIIMPFEDYEVNWVADAPEKKKTAVTRWRESAAETELLEKINQEIVDWKDKQVASAPEVQLADIQESDELRIENLPLA